MNNHNEFDKEKDLESNMESGGASKNIDEEKNVEKTTNAEEQINFCEPNTGEELKNTWKPEDANEQSNAAEQNHTYEQNSAEEPEFFGGTAGFYGANPVDSEERDRILNSYLSESCSLRKMPSEKVAGESKIKKLWLGIGATLLAAVILFSGAFMGVYWACQTAVLGDAAFFEALVLKNSGITVNKAEIDMISGNYIEDTIALTEKILKTTVEIRMYSAEGKHVSSGSGVIFNSDGRIITNYHVVYGENKARVTLYDGSSYDAQILHLDKISDLAVIKIDAGKELTAAIFADSTKAKAGQSVAICGNPLGLGLSVSFGKISHPDREIGDIAGRFLQVDASINPGNSGGGIYDGAGQLLGIVNAKASGTNVDGIGYSIPSARVVDVVNQLMSPDGFVKGRPAMGVQWLTVNSDTWELFNTEEYIKGYLYNSNYGIYVGEVFEDFRSNYAPELKKGDRLISIDGKNFENVNVTELGNWVLTKNIGDKVEIVVERLKELVEDQQGNITAKYYKIRIQCTIGERNWKDE